MATVIKVLDVKKFVGPLKALMNSVNSVIFAKRGETLMVNTRSEDGSQMANVWYKPAIVAIESGDLEKFGIYNLSEFVTVLTMFGDINSLTLSIEGNEMTINYNDKSKVDYVLSALTLITEGALGPKNPLDFHGEFEVDSAFIKKVKTISNSINVNVLKLKASGGQLSYSISNKVKDSQSHAYTEKIDGECAVDFDVSVTIKDEKRDNFGLFFDGPKYKVGVHAKTVQFEAETTDYEKLRYFISPLRVGAAATTGA